AHGRRPHHRRLCGGRHRRPGLDHGLDRDRLRPRRRGRLHEGLLSGGVQHGHLRHHGGRAARAAPRPLFAGLVTAPARHVRAAAGVPRAPVAALAVMTAVLVGAPFLAYPVFLMKALCFALFACAFNLLIGYVGLLSFGHAVFLGTAGYAAAHSAKVWGFRPELAILFGTVVAAGLGIVIGALAIRSKGIYFANITLALAQMVLLVSLQAAFTGGEDGIRAVPRGRLLGFLDFRDTLTLYFVVLAVFLAGFLLIYRAIHSPFGQVLKAIRENEA